MQRNYWQEYWESYFKFMALYLSEFRNVYPDADIKHEYAEVSKLFEPSMLPEDYEVYDEYDVRMTNYDEDYTIHLLHHQEVDNLLILLYYQEEGNFLILLHHQEEDNL